MSLAQAALLVGLFGAPLAFLALGHHYRRRSPAGRAAFWGGVAGYTVGVLCTVVAMHLPATADVLDRIPLDGLPDAAAATLGEVRTALRGDLTTEALAGLSETLDRLLTQLGG